MQLRHFNAISLQARLENQRPSFRDISPSLCDIRAPSTLFWDGRWLGWKVLRRRRRRRSHAWWCLFGRMGLGLMLELFRLAGCLTLLGQDKVGPGLALAKVLANNFGQCDHPAVLLRSAVSIEVDGLAVSKAHAKSLLDEHVTFFLFCKCGFPPAPFLGRCVVSHERRLIVDELAGFSKIDRSSRLSCDLVVRRKFRAIQREESSSPILENLISHRRLYTRVKSLTGQSPPCWLKYPSHFLGDTFSASLNSRMHAFMLLGISSSVAPFGFGT